MEVKKSPKANLETKKLTSYLLGYILVFACLFVSFESIQTKIEIAILAGVDQDAIDEEMVPCTIQQLPPPPPPPPPKAQNIIRIVQNTEDIKEVEIEDTEIEEDSSIDMRVFDPNEDYGDTDAVVEESPIPYATMECVPKFPGGEKVLLKWLKKNLKYPKSARNKGVTGEVLVSFIIGKNGKVSKGKIDRPLFCACDKEALRLIALMPNWSPGKINGKFVNTLYQWAVEFRLTP